MAAGEEGLGGDHMAQEMPAEYRWRYEVTSVWGSAVGVMKVGDELIECIWKGRGETEWWVWDHKKGEVTGGWMGRYLGHRA
jgi:hypothetical protein